MPLIFGKSGTQYVAMALLSQRRAKTNGDDDDNDDVNERLMHLLILLRFFPLTSFQKEFEKEQPNKI